MLNTIEKNQIIVFRGNTYSVVEVCDNADLVLLLSHPRREGECVATYGKTMVLRLADKALPFDTSNRVPDTLQKLLKDLNDCYCGPGDYRRKEETLQVLQALVEAQCETRDNIVGLKSCVADLIERVYDQLKVQAGTKAAEQSENLTNRPCEPRQ